MIPLQILFLIWLAAMLISATAAYVSCRAGNKPMGVALAGFSLGAASMVSFYAFLLYVPFTPSTYQVSIAWSRWAIAINGLTILGGSISALIVSKDRHSENDT